MTLVTRTWDDAQGMLGYLRSNVLPYMPKHVAIGAGYNSTMASDTVECVVNRVGINCSG